MAELVEHRRHIIKTEQRRLARARLGEIRDVDYDGPGSQQITLIDEAILPCAAVFIRTLKIIGIKQCERFSVRVENFKDAHIGLIYGKIFSLFESNSVKLVGGKEHAILQHVFEFEVGLDLRFVEVVLSLANFLGVVLPVLRAEGETALLRIDNLLHARG